MFKLFNSYFLKGRINLLPKGTHTIKHTTRQQATFTKARQGTTRGHGQNAYYTTGYKFKLAIQLKPNGLGGYNTRVALGNLLAGRAFFWGGACFRGHKRLAVLRVPVLQRLRSGFSCGGGVRPSRVLGWGLRAFKERSPSYDGCSE